MNVQIPTYRAKKIDSDEYVKGWLMPLMVGDGYFIRCLDYKKMNILECESEIDLSTLAIHFPSMFDSNSKKIFASLSEDGKGGDIVSGETKLPNLHSLGYDMIFDNQSVKHRGTYCTVGNSKSNYDINYCINLTVTGIQK